MMRTPVDYFLSIAAGFHYCKVTNWGLSHIYDWSLFMIVTLRAPKTRWIENYYIYSDTYLWSIFLAWLQIHVTVSESKPATALKIVTLTCEFLRCVWGPFKFLYHSAPCTLSNLFSLLLLNALSYRPVSASTYLLFSIGTDRCFHLHALWSGCMT